MRDRDLDRFCAEFAEIGERANLSTLANEINEHHAACESAMKAGLENALQAGRLLAEVKSQLPHGSFGEWLAENCHGSERTAQAYMRVAKRWPEIQAKAQHVADLTYRDALRLLTEPRAETPETPEEDFAEQDAANDAAWLTAVKRYEAHWVKIWNEANQFWVDQGYDVRAVVKGHLHSEAAA